MNNVTIFFVCGPQLIQRAFCMSPDQRRELRGLCEIVAKADLNPYKALKPDADAPWKEDETSVELPTLVKLTHKLGAVYVNPASICMVDFVDDE